MISFLLLATAGLGVLPQQDSEEEKAHKELEKAEEHGRESRYQRAWQGYQRVAERYPTTAAGKIAASRSGANAFLGWDFVREAGPLANRLDIVIMGEAWDLSGQDFFDDGAEAIADYIERDDVFREYASFVNVIRVNLKSDEVGADGYGREYSTALDGRYVIQSDGFAWLTVDPQRVHEMLNQLPDHDGLAIVYIRDGAIGSTDPGLFTLTRLNEDLLRGWGSAFANLGDESSLEFNFVQQVDGSPNLSATPEPDEVPWAHWLEARVRSIGVHEGGGGRLKNVWRPTSSGCRMASNKPDFCPVCREALVLRIYDYVDPIVETIPQAHGGVLDIDQALRPDDVLRFEVRTMTPATHPLELSWWILPGAQTLGWPDDRTRYALRSARGPLPAIADEPIHVTKKSNGRHRFEIKSGALKPGRYRVVCRARDTTKVRGHKYPWVLKDRQESLQSQRSWWLDIR